MQTDPLASQEAINQLVELGYIEKLDENREKRIAQTARELRYNLARAYMDGDQHQEAVKILQELYENDPQEHRFGVQLALCYRALDWIEPLESLVETLHERRVEQAQESREKLKAVTADLEERKTQVKEDVELRDLMSDEERREYVRLRSRAQLRTYDIQYLRGYVAAAKGEHLAALGHLLEAEKAEPRRPGLHIQIGQQYLELKRWQDAERAFEKGLEIDPENAHAHLGLARSYLRRRRAKRAAEAAVKSVSLEYNYPMAHFVLGQALAQMRRYPQAVEAFEVAVSLNPNFAQAHRRLAQIYSRRLDQHDKTQEHDEIARQIRRAGKPKPPKELKAATSNGPGSMPIEEPHLQMLRTSDNGNQPTVTVVTGLPRSGTSMMMQMLDRGGLPILTDGKREADDDNPRGYYELEAATRLRSDDTWVVGAAGKGVKLVAQLLHRLPLSQSYRVIFMQRDLDEVLASQNVMLDRLGRQGTSQSSEQLQSAYRQQISRAKHWLAMRGVPVLFVDYRGALDDPRATADALAAFVGDDLDAEAMTDAVEKRLYRQRKTEPNEPAATSSPQVAES